jgi:hypothetical protein
VSLKHRFINIWIVVSLALGMSVIGVACGDDDSAPKDTKDAEAIADSAISTNAIGKSCVDVNCDDSDPCTYDSCDTGECSHTPVADGTSCADSDLCNGQEICQAGECKEGIPVTCASSVTCQSATCDPKKGCVYQAIKDGTGCDDHNACTNNDSCRSGQCVGESVDCSDDSLCTLDSCDNAGGCRHTAMPDGASCADGNICNGFETCQSGVCAAGKALGCDDGNPCTSDLCDPVSGCKHEPVADGTSCADPNVCDGEEVCKAGRCVTGKPLVCDDHKPCTAHACSRLDGACSYTTMADGASCDDNNLCNGREQCLAGACTSGKPLACDRGNKCMANYCDPKFGCQAIAVADGTSLPDPSVCNGVEWCLRGNIQPGIPLNCDDANPCTADSCNASSGCVHTALQDGMSCEDNNSCTGDGPKTCLAGICKGEKTSADGAACNNGNACDGEDHCWDNRCLGTGTSVFSTAVPSTYPLLASKDRDGNVFLAGSVTTDFDLGCGLTVAQSDDGLATADMMVVKLGKDGKCMYSSSWRFNGEDNAIDVARTGDGDFVLLGSSESNELEITFVDNTKTKATGKLAQPVSLLMLIPGGDCQKVWSEEGALIGCKVYDFQQYSLSKDVVGSTLKGMDVSADGTIAVVGSTDQPEVSFGGTKLSGTTKDMVIATFTVDKSDNGNKKKLRLLNSARFGGLGNEEGWNVAFDRTGNLLVTGVTDSGFSFANGKVVAAPPSGSGYGSVFVTKFGADLKPLWVTSFYGASRSPEPSAIAVDSTGNVWVGGDILGNVDFGKGVVSSSGDINAAHGFVAKFAAADGSSRFGKLYGGKGKNNVLHLAVDRADDLFVAGWFVGTIDFGNGSLESLKGTQDGVLAKLKATGEISWQRQVGSAEGRDSVNFVAFDPSDDSRPIIVTGDFNSTINFGKSPATEIANPAKGYNLPFGQYMTLLTPGDTIPNCDDRNPCTADSCDPVKGCQSTPLAESATCKDGKSK